MKITIKNVAESLRMDPQTVRLMLQRGLLPFGTAFKKPDNQYWSYVIFPEKFKEYCGGVKQ